ncbi:MAG: TonB-dependent receptor [Breznakibacter sp.]
MKELLDKSLWMCVLIFCIGTTVYGQETKRVTGKVTSEAGETLPGVSVLIKGTTAGTITDIEGVYSISAKAGDVLAISYLGYDNVEERIGDKSTINFVLKESNISLNEVVAIGYGKAKRSDLTSAISSVQGDEVKAMSVGNPVEALQGKAPGIQVISGSGAPGNSPKVLVRGFTSINLSTDPLYVVDGVPMGTNLNFLNANEIESIDVLKDASASAIYGSRASNGVVLITTKRGTTGKAKFSADLSYGLQSFKKPYEMADASEYAEIMNQSLNNAGLGDRFDDPSALGKGTDWWGAGINRYSPQRNFAFQVSGGTEKYRYAASVNYYDQESFYNSGNWKRITGRLSVDWDFSEKISAGVMVNPRREVWDNTPSWYQDYLLIDPITPIYRPEAEQEGLNEYSIYQRSYYTYVWNPVARDARNFGNGGYYAATTNAYALYKPIKGLELKTQISGDYRFNHSDDFVPDFEIDGAHEFNELNYVFRDHEFNSYWNWTNTATWEKEFKDHKIVAMGGATMEKWYGRNIEGTKDGIPNNSELLRELDAATTNDKIYGTEWESSIESFMGRLSYNYRSKYYLTATYRVDGSSKFMANNKWASFPSASVAWRISDEPFMESYSFIDDLKLRAGWGRLGNQNLPSDAYASKLSQNYYVFGSGEGIIVNTTQPSQVKNEDLKWETVEDINIGTDFTLLNNKITGSVEYYRKNTKDMLFQMPYPYYSGYPNGATIWSNIGSMRSQGWEFALGYHNQKGGVKYDVTFTLMTGSVEATKLPSTTPVVYGNSEKTRTVVGDEPGYFYGYKTDGLFQNSFEVNSHASETGELMQPYAQPGDIRFVDVNGDGELTGDDRTKIGSPWPDFTTGLNLSLAYKGFDFRADLYASVGNDVVDQTKDDRYSTTASEHNVVSGLLNKAWHGEGTSNSIPRVSHVDNNQNYTKFSDFYVEDGSFLRLKNIQLGYTLPAKASGVLGLSRCRIYVAGQNLLTFTKVFRYGTRGFR